MRVVIIVPTFNEKENIKLLLGRIVESLKNNHWIWSVLVVDDNSPDGTGDIVNSFSRKNKRIFLLTHAQKVGLGAAYLAGMQEAFGKMGADVVVTMDADLSHNPKSLPAFLQKIEEGADFVVGSRYIKGGAIPKNWPIHRKLLSIFGNLLTSLLLGSRAHTDWTSGYRAIRGHVYLKVKRELENKSEFRGYTFNISFAYHAVCDGFKVTEVPIVFPDRKSGKSKLGLEYLYHTPIFLFRTRLRMMFEKDVKNCCHYSHLQRGEKYRQDVGRVGKKRTSKN